MQILFRDSGCLVGILRHFNLCGLFNTTIILVKGHLFAHNEMVTSISIKY